MTLWFTSTCFFFFFKWIWTVLNGEPPYVQTRKRILTTRLKELPSPLDLRQSRSLSKQTIINTGTITLLTLEKSEQVENG